MRAGAEEIVNTLKEAGVEVVFGIPSIHNIRIYEALRHEPSIRHILCRQEATATHMADGYARAGNRLGVVITSTGPGAGYAMPAIQEAWGSCSPLLMINTNIKTSKIGRAIGTLHEVEDQAGIFRTVTKDAFSLQAGDDPRARTQQAIQTATSGRPGPVYMEVPTDLLDKPISTDKAVSKDGTLQKGEGAISDITEGNEKEINSNELEKAISLLKGANRPLIVVGAEAVRAGIAGNIQKLAETLCAPVISTVAGKGVLAEDNFLAFGNATRMGVVREMIQSCDVAIAIGTRLREVDIKRRGLDLPNLIHITWDEQWVGKNFPTEVPLTGDVPTILGALLEKLTGFQSPESLRTDIEEIGKRRDQELAGIREIQPELLYLDTLRNAQPREGTLVVDNTQLGYWAEYFYPSYGPGRLMAAKGCAVIGFSFPAAIGAKIENPDRSVVALIGDGGFLYGTQELATCIQHKIGFPVIVVNDGSFGIIGHLQRRAYNAEYESHLNNPDFVALAKSYGAQASRVDTPGGLSETLQEALASEEMWVIELAASFPEPPFGKY